jgi:hypothetical protein
MAKDAPKHERYVDSEVGLVGFSSIATGFWRAAEKLRDEADKQTAGQASFTTRPFEDKRRSVRTQIVSGPLMVTTSVTNVTPPSTPILLYP